MISAIRYQFTRLYQDASLSAFVAGFIAVLVGLTSSAVLVFQAASSAGLDPQQSSSWLGSLCVGMGFLSIFFSLKYRVPILTAWSTAGAAILVTGLQGIPLSQAVGAFFVSAVLIFLSGVTGAFEKVMNKISIPMASALLAGVLLHFSLDSILAFKTEPLLIGCMFLIYLFGRKYWPKWTMLGVLVIGIILAIFLNVLHFEKIHLRMTEFIFTVPEFSWQACLSIGIPLFVVTMASQNLTGYSLIRVYGYHVPISPLLTGTGFANMLSACFGGFTINLAAITAAIGMEPSVHPQPEKRYFSAVSCGFLYIIVGLFAASITSLFSAFPTEMVVAIAGFALLPTIANALETALKDVSQRKPAFITFVVASSGLTLFGIGSAFWSLVAGIIAQFILRPTLSKPEAVVVTKI